MYYNNYGTQCGCGYQDYGYTGGYATGGYGSTFAIILVLFILLVIITASTI